jgi:hypothetical protein
MQWLGATSPDRGSALAVRTFLAAAATRTRARPQAAGVAQVRSALAPMLQPAQMALPIKGRALRVIGTAGRSRTVAPLAALAGRPAHGLRLSWRTVYWHARLPAETVGAGRRLIVDSHDPLLRIEGLSRTAASRAASRACATAGSTGIEGL